MAKTARKTRERLSDAFSPLRSHEVVDVTEVRPRRRRRKKSAKTRVQEEAREQKRWVAWAREKGLCFNHQNNGASTKARRIHLTQMGCTAGAADVLIFDRLPYRPEARGLALEFKSPGGKQSTAQVRWMVLAMRHGWIYQIVGSADEAKEACLGYGLGIPEHLKNLHKTDPAA